VTVKTFNVTKDLNLKTNAVIIELSIHQRNLKHYPSISTKILSSTTVYH